MNWEIKKTDIEGCYQVYFPKFEDGRGIFSEIYKHSEFMRLGLPIMTQDNYLRTQLGGVRAMHWQASPSEQAKLIHVISGTIFDVIFDIRPTSATYGKFATFNLNPDSPLLFVAAGCAHGFQSTSTESIVNYKTDKEYDQNAQRSFLWNDPELNIPWPITNAIVSEKDSKAPVYKDILK